LYAIAIVIRPFHWIDGIS